MAFLADLWHIHRERFLAAGLVFAIATALFVVFFVLGKGGSSAKEVAEADCIPGADPIVALRSNEFQRLTPEEAVGINPRLNELSQGSWPVVYWWEGGSRWGVYVSVLKGARHGFYGDQVHDITSAAYGPGSAIQPTHITGYEGYEQWVPRKPGHTVAFETRCDQVGFYGRTEADAKAAAKHLLPLIDPPSGQPQPLDSSRS